MFSRAWITANSLVIAKFVKFAHYNIHLILLPYWQCKQLKRYFNSKMLLCGVAAPRTATKLAVFMMLPPPARLRLLTFTHRITTSAQECRIYIQGILLSSLLALFHPKLITQYSPHCHH